MSRRYSNRIKAGVLGVLAASSVVMNRLMNRLMNRQVPTNTTKITRNVARPRRTCQGARNQMRAALIWWHPSGRCPHSKCNEQAAVFTD